MAWLLKVPQGVRSECTPRLDSLDDWAKFARHHPQKWPGGHHPSLGSWEEDSSLCHDKFTRWVLFPLLRAKRSVGTGSWTDNRPVVCPPHLRLHFMQASQSSRLKRRCLWPNVRPGCPAENTDRVDNGGFLEISGRVRVSCRSHQTAQAFVVVSISSCGLLRAAPRRSMWPAPRQAER